MKNILVLIHDDAGQESRLQAALDLTRALGGHLIGLDVVQMPLQAANMFAVGAELELLEDERTRERSNVTTIRQRLAREGVPWELQEEIGDLDDCLARNAGLADLIVVNRKLDDALAPDMRWLASMITLHTHKPVIAVSEDCARFDAAGVAVVAWDGSAPSMAALTAAVPLLKLAETVILVEVQGDTPGTVHEAAAYLSRHDVHAEIDLIARFKDDSSSIADLLQSRCENAGAAYCVMGAYGHLRLSESLFGGTTRAMLGGCKVPLVLAN